MCAWHLFRVGVDGGCVGHRFFQSPGTVSVLKQMKQRLNQAVDYHLNYNPDNDSYVGCGRFVSDLSHSHVYVCEICVCV